MTNNNKLQILQQRLQNLNNFKNSFSQNGLACSNATIDQYLDNLSLFVASKKVLFPEARSGRLAAYQIAKENVAEQFEYFLLPSNNSYSRNLEGFKQFLVANKVVSTKEDLSYVSGSKNAKIIDSIQNDKLFLLKQNNSAKSQSISGKTFSNAKSKIENAINLENKPSISQEELEAMLRDLKNPNNAKNSQNNNKSNNNPLPKVKTKTDLEIENLETALKSELSKSNYNPALVSCLNLLKRFATNENKQENAQELSNYIKKESGFAVEKQNQAFNWLNQKFPLLMQEFSQQTKKLQEENVSKEDNIDSLLNKLINPKNAANVQNKGKSR